MSYIQISFHDSCLRATHRQVGQNRTHLEASVFILRQHIVVKNDHGMLREFACVQIPEGKSAIGIHHRLQVDLAHLLEGAYVEGVLTQDTQGHAHFLSPSTTF